MDSIAAAKQEIRAVIAGSRVPEDPRHADNTLQWLLQLEPAADAALQIAALGHDIDRATSDHVRRKDYRDYDAFKADHARRGSHLVRRILRNCGVDIVVIEEACRLVEVHEVGGDPRSDLLKDADSISFFDVNLPLYYAREGWKETKRRSLWGYRRLSAQARKVVGNISYEEKILLRLLEEVIHESDA